MTAAAWLTTHFDGSSRAGAMYLLRASGFLAGGVSPEKLLEVITDGELERTLQALRTAIEADPQGAHAAAGQVLDELARRAGPTPATGGPRRNSPSSARSGPRPPSDRQFKFLRDLGHPNPAAVRTAREAWHEIQRRLAQGQGARR